MPLPEKMTVIAMTAPGDPEVLQPQTRDVPKPAATQVLLRVHAAGVNRPDVMQRQGKYPAPAGAPDYPGLEIAGEVAALGDGASRWKVGDKVCALVPGGGYAEYALVDETNVLPVPNGFSYVEAAALPETFFTVWSNVFDRGQLSKGETLLVHGGASGIGTTAIQLAVALGHTVYATAGSDERVEAINRLGGIGINYKTEVYEDVIKSKTGGRGVEVILDMVSGDYINRDLTCLADDGRIVIIALLGGVKATINCGEILRRRLTITGSTLRSRSVEFKAQLAQALKERVWPLLEAGQVRPLIHATFPLEKASEAHAMMEAGEQVGKIILVP